MPTNPFGSGTRPWSRKTLAKKAADITVLPSAEIVVDETGGIYGTDGVTQTKDLKALVTQAQLNTVVPKPSTVLPSGQAWVTDGAGGGSYRAAGSVTGVAIDTDGRPYYAAGANAAGLNVDTDGVIYFVPS